TSGGMTATERAHQLQPLVREVVGAIERTILPREEFEASRSQRIFRIMASDYAESTLIPRVLKHLRQHAPHVIIDVLTPSDVSFSDVEQGRVDMAINRFEEMPLSFHQKTVWKDSFSCILNRDNPIISDFSLDNYLAAQHIWVSKTGFGVGVGVNPKDVQRLGWVDLALAELGHKRDISVFTRHYQVAMLLAQQRDLIATLPSRVALLERDNPAVAVLDPPFEIPPFELKVAWSPLLHHDASHRWLRQLIFDVAKPETPATDLKNEAPQ
ncbi:MAG: LysR substrate-binding domain-containing protein, partial [Pseudomonadota bacterium]